MNDLSNSISIFLKSFGRDYEFPAGGQHELLTKQEQILFQLILESKLSDKQKISAFAKNREWSDCYSLVIFAVRLAILAARKKQQSLYRIGLILLVAGSPKVDWRDALGAFAIFNTCGERIGMDFQAEVKSVAPNGETNKLLSTLESFFSRSDEMRSVDTMGFQECGDGDSLTFRRKGTIGNDCP